MTEEYIILVLRFAELLMFFFFQAEDGIRDVAVTGVQPCALPISQLVAAAEDAVGCNECHSKSSRLQAIDGIYIPGRDAVKWLDMGGWGIALLTLIGVILHGFGRIISFYWSKRSCPKE